MQASDSHHANYKRIIEEADNSAKNGWYMPGSAFLVELDRISGEEGVRRFQARNIQHLEDGTRLELTSREKSVLYSVMAHEREDPEARTHRRQFLATAGATTLGLGYAGDEMRKAHKEKTKCREASQALYEDIPGESTEEKAARIKRLYGQAWQHDSQQDTHLERVAYAGAAELVGLGVTGNIAYSEHARRQRIAEHYIPDLQRSLGEFYFDHAQLVQDAGLWEHTLRRSAERLR